ncbi:LysR family transcriptional regulator [Thalassospira mesophila]|uniref:LysR family transcriptional regulator n=1 Tax=Thalassospira mesophila TaxID=1293891 RepID=A0A1Y2L584_9PROT|nr:LysR family transcriptional regulator [Thalassospira mesophila]OSQ41014.1 LysR family transcriptional regulator [Thalassospira mesophila]
MLPNRSGEMEVFLRVADAGSFSAAARRLQLTPSAVAKLIARLEERLGAQLFVRSTRNLKLTREGHAYYHDASRILEDINTLEARLAHDSATPRGAIRVNATIPFGNHVLVPVLGGFLEKYPEVTIDLSLTDDVIDILDERADIAIRSGTLRDSRLLARKLGVSRRVIIAAPSYIERHGRPHTPAELENHNCLNFNFRRAQDQWALNQTGGDGNDNSGGHDDPGARTGNLQVNNGETMRQLALAGVGIGRLARFHVGEDIKQGRLESLFEDGVEPEFEQIHAVFVGQRQMPLRMRVFLDYLAKNISIE